MRYQARVSRTLMFLCLAVSLAGCGPYDGPERTSFAGISYSGNGAPGLTVLQGQIAPIGTAASVDARDISDHTVYGLEGVLTADAIILRRNNGVWALFLSRPFTEIPALCAYFEPRPSDCP